MAALLWIILALARPVWGTEIETIDTQRVSIMFVLDVSNSMNAQDIQPSRLERARLSLRDLLTRLSGNEIGLILFAGDALVRFPLTTDTSAADTLIQSVSSDAIGQQGTNITQALQLALEALATASAEQRLIVLMTDGENHEGDLDAVLTEAQARGISILVVGYGNPEGTTIPIRDETGVVTGVKTDPAGNPVQSRLDETTLSAISRVTNGAYWRSMPAGSEIDQLIAAIDQRGLSRLADGIQRRLIERFDIFAGLAILSILIDILTSDRRWLVT